METTLAILWFILGAAIGGLIELVIAILFEQTARKHYRRLRRVWLAMIEAIRDTRFGEREYYRIGRWETNVVILEGSPREPYDTGRVTCHLAVDPLILPGELEKVKDKIDQEQLELLQQKGTRDFHNGAMVAFYDYLVGYTHLLEEPILSLKFKTTDYYSFMATALRIDETLPGSNPSETIRAKYVGRQTYREPNPIIATSFGVNICVVTNDHYVVLGKRADSRVSHYHGVYAVPLMESVNPEKDRDSQQQLDVYETGIRGAREELGIEIDKDEIKFFTLQADVRYYLYGLTGLVLMYDYSREDLRGLATRGIRDKWENSEFRYIPFEPRAVADFVRNNGGVAAFHPAAFVAIVQSLIYQHGQRAVAKAFQ